MNHYKVEPPFLMSFSGGRTSGYLLRKVLDAWGGVMPEGGVVVFANTGKEHPKTLDFVQQVQEWCPIVWVEYQATSPKFVVVDAQTASRKGEPFTALITSKKYLPNPATRFCTSDLKVTPMRRYMESIGFPDYTTILGLRADEPRRVAKIRNDPTRDMTMPLADMGVDRATVLDWWAKNKFDLELPNNDPAFGNCDLCFLKGMSQIERVIRAQPELTQWWIDEETRLKARFSRDRPTYYQVRVQTENQGLLFADVDDNQTIPCDCTD